MFLLGGFLTELCLYMNNLIQIGKSYWYSDRPFIDFHILVKN